jgi:hypothetical protein
VNVLGVKVNFVPRSCTYKNKTMPPGSNRSDIHSKMLVALFMVPLVDDFDFDMEFELSLFKRQEE